MLNCKEKQLLTTLGTLVKANFTHLVTLYPYQLSQLGILLTNIVASLASSVMYKMNAESTVHLMHRLQGEC